MFLRPTESPIVFLQQLGRGLRRCKGKEYLNVLDFIGNYEKAGRIRFILSEGKTTERTGNSLILPFDYPDDCLVDLDMRVIDLFQKMDRRSVRVRDLIKAEFDRVEEFRGKRPTRMELFTYMDDTVYEICMKHSAENPFKRYLSYLNDMGKLLEEERRIYQEKGREFLNLLETTSMVKVYKMPVLLAFYNHGTIRMAVTQKELLESWKEFFDYGTNWKDLKTKITFDEYTQITDQAHLRNIVQNPVHFLQESGKGFFIQKDGYALAIRDDLESMVKEAVFVEQMGDIINYRIMDYYQRRYHENEEK